MPSGAQLRRDAAEQVDRAADEHHVASRAGRGDRRLQRLPARGLRSFALGRFGRALGAILTTAAFLFAALLVGITLIAFHTFHAALGAALTALLTTAGRFAVFHTGFAFRPFSFSAWT